MTRTRALTDLAGGLDAAPRLFERRGLRPPRAPPASLGPAPPGSARGRQPPRLEPAAWRASTASQDVSQTLQEQTHEARRVDLDGDATVGSAAGAPGLAGAANPDPGWLPLEQGLVEGRTDGERVVKRQPV